MKLYGCGNMIPFGMKPHMCHHPEHIKLHMQIVFCISTFKRSFNILPHYAKREREREIKFIGLFGDTGHRGPYSPYKPCNHNLYIGIIIFPHIDNP